MTGLKFQPYGVIPGEYKAKGLDTEIVMADWRPDLCQEDRVSTFNAWRQERLDELTTMIWPRFDFENRVWIGKATKFAEGLTELEINVMIDAFIHPNRILEQCPSSPLGVNDIQNHLNHYEYEDQNPHPPGVNYKEYDSTLTIVEEKEFLKTMLLAISAGTSIGKKSAGHFWFKFKMQRPRPLYSAMVFQREEAFESELTQRGQHPSIVSGHCLQGTLMVCAVLEHWIKSGNPNLTQKRIDSLAQYMVDFGDRRVFAGVHYPTDNVGSWVLALSLIPEVFEDSQPILDFVRNAILKKSTVFNTIREQYTRKDALKHTQTVLDLLKKYGLPVDVKSAT